MLILIAINTIIFLFLSGLHVYWAFGGTWGFAAAMPTTPDGESTIDAGKLATLIVAFGLLLFALVTWGNSGYFNQMVSMKLIHIGSIIIGAIFLIRAIGDFRYVGFFKKMKGTLFATQDTRIYSPLCLCIAIMEFCMVLI
ncbi:MAG: DUF3995 domain-containing protein [Chitinophaga sp.]|uniref:DUF3995 domain-containing protein n=1 Tax=Chitinophaga sp. TaxID=1869181 RepID=UPI0025C51FEA|nr:DUF3995 domain-containing protein [Chitinophaga sp.]MBV8255946.1 DUF3995 domain-containing protein [Chitinophaga sp.]